MNVTMLYDDKVTQLSAAIINAEQLWLSPDEMHRATGWELKLEGLCRGDACVRTDSSWTDANGNIDVAAFANHMGQPIVRDDAHNAWAFGESVSTRHDALFSLEAPNFTLPDIDGRLHSLSDYRGKKVFLYSWGSY
ncbi:MAG: hypothetical protein ACI9BW_001280 [Gammaproteobacteria bacterium]